MPVIDSSIQADANDLENMHKLARLLNEQAENSPESDPEPLLLAQGSDNPLVVPDSLRTVLREAVDAFVRGEAVMVMSCDTQITTQVAADYLGVSRPYLISLLNAGEIPYTRLRSHRRIRFGDVASYRERRASERLRALDDLTREMHEAGLYTMAGVESPDE